MEHEKRCSDRVFPGNTVSNDGIPFIRSSKPVLIPVPDRSMKTERGAPEELDTPVV